MRVLVAESFSDLSIVLEELLVALGHEARVALTTEDALSALTDFLPEALLCAVDSVHLDGFAVVEKVLADGNLPGTRLLAMTTDARVLTRAQATEKGFHVCLVKPFGPADLAKALGSE